MPSDKHYGVHMPIMTDQLCPKKLCSQLPQVGSVKRFLWTDQETVWSLCWEMRSQHILLCLQPGAKYKTPQCVCKILLSFSSVSTQAFQVFRIPFHPIFTCHFNNFNIQHKDRAYTRLYCYNWREWNPVVLNRKQPDISMEIMPEASTVEALVQAVGTFLWDHAFCATPGRCMNFTHWKGHYWVSVQMLRHTRCQRNTACLNFNQRGLLKSFQSCECIFITSVCQGN